MCAVEREFCVRRLQEFCEKHNHLAQGVLREWSELGKINTSTLCASTPAVMKIAL
jgi:hypothetical protein